MCAGTAHIDLNSQIPFVKSTYAITPVHIGVHDYLQIWPPLAVNFLALWVWKLIIMTNIRNDRNQLVERVLFIFPTLLSCKYEALLAVDFLALWVWKLFVMANI